MDLVGTWAKFKIESRGNPSSESSLAAPLEPDQDQAHSEWKSSLGQRKSLNMSTKARYLHFKHYFYYIIDAIGVRPCGVQSMTSMTTSLYIGSSKSITFLFDLLR